jgi:hypothetical protein
MKTGRSESEGVSYPAVAKAWEVFFLSVGVPDCAVVFDFESKD